MADPEDSTVKKLVNSAERAAQQKEHTQAEALYRDSLKVCSSSDNYDPVEVVAILHGLAVVLEAQNRDEEALRVRERAMWILRSLSRADSYRKELRKQLDELSGIHAESEAALKRLADLFSNRDRTKPAKS